MTTARVIDIQRLSTLAHEYERQMLQFFHDLVDTPSSERIRREAAKAPFDDIRFDSTGNFLARVGSGSHVILISARGAAGLAGTICAGKLIQELGMYDDFTLWAANSAQVAADGGIRPDCVLVAEPTNLCIQMREAEVEGFLNESHPLVQAAIDTYETLFELPPIVSQAPVHLGTTGAPAIAFGAGEPAGTRHLLKAAQFYAAFPTMFVETMKAGVSRQ